MKSRTEESLNPFIFWNYFKNPEWVSWIPVWLLLLNMYRDIIVFLFLQEKIYAVWQRDTRDTFFNSLFFRCLKTVKSLCYFGSWKIETPSTNLTPMCYLLEPNFYIAVIVAQMHISGLCHHFTFASITSHCISY